MGLGKEKGSSRINRYEHQVTAIGFDNLGTLAEILDVPVSYLLAADAPMADAILALSRADERQREAIARMIPALIDASMLSSLSDQVHPRDRDGRASLPEQGEEP